MNNLKEYVVETTFKVKGTLVIHANNDEDAYDEMYQMSDDQLINESDISIELEVDEVDLI